jgi:hypothetical protein
MQQWQMNRYDSAFFLFCFSGTVNLIRVGFVGLHCLSMTGALARLHSALMAVITHLAGKLRHAAMANEQVYNVYPQFCIFPLWHRNSNSNGFCWVTVGYYCLRVTGALARLHSALMAVITHLAGKLRLAAMANEQVYVQSLVYFFLFQHRIYNRNGFFWVFLILSLVEGGSTGAAAQRTDQLQVGYYLVSFCGY